MGNTEKECCPENCKCLNETPSRDVCSKYHVELNHKILLYINKETVIRPFRCEECIKEETGVDVKYEVKSVVGYNTPNKKVLCVNGEPIVVLNGDNRASTLIGYLMGVVEEDKIIDKKVLGVLNKYRNKDV